MGTVVLYTPDAPDGRAYRTYANRDELKQDPLFKRPEWVEYFKSRVSHGNVAYTWQDEVSKREGIDLSVGSKRKPGLEARFNTTPVKDDFTEQQYKAVVATKRENADVVSITNEELHQESLQKKINGWGGLALDAVDILPTGKLGKGLRMLARQANPRKVLTKLPIGTHLLRNVDEANQVPFGIARHSSVNPTGQLLKGYDVPISDSGLKQLKYDKASGIYRDGANNEYLRIDNKFYRTNHQRDSSGELQRGIFRPNNSTDRFDVERVGDRWNVKQKDERLLGGGGDKRQVESSPDGTPDSKRVKSDKSSLGDLDGRNAKVIGDPQATIYRVDDEVIRREIPNAAKNKLDAKYGDGNYEIIGYHVSPDKNRQSLIEKGFSPFANEGGAGGVGGMNRDGPGLYVSQKPSTSYIPPNEKSSMYVVVRSKKGDTTWAESSSTSRGWSSSGNNVSKDNGDFIRSSVRGDIKITEQGIPKVELIEVGVFEPRAPSVVISRGGAVSEIAKPSDASVSKFIDDRINKFKDLGNGISAASDSDEKIRLINELAGKLFEDRSASDTFRRGDLVRLLKNRYGVGRD
ncbi:hypothetical protein BLA18110_07914 [Burkholderia lata]|nr:hypothetical protein BLA18110_07914 [Burkholderia lata]